jgi:hypothetical protein
MIVRSRLLLLSAIFVACNIVAARADFSAGLAAHGEGRFREAATLWRDSALAGDSRAQVAIGVAHARGQGTLRSAILAHAWFNIAAASGEEAAFELRDRAEALLAPRDLREAERLAFSLLMTIDDARAATAIPDRPAPVEPESIARLAATGALGPVRRLLDAGASPNQSDASGRSPLGAALISRHYDMAQLLVGAGANVDALAPSGVSLLGEAIARRDGDAVAILFAAGASLFGPGAGGVPAFVAASQDTAMAELLGATRTPLSRAEARELQARLTAAGEAPGPIDGLPGARTRRAADRFLISNGLPPADGWDRYALAAAREIVPREAATAVMARAASAPRQPAVANTPGRQTPSRQPRTPSGQSSRNSIYTTTSPYATTSPYR